jgi:hypothetical protein
MHEGRVLCGMSRVVVGLILPSKTHTQIDSNQIFANVPLELRPSLGATIILIPARVGSAAFIKIAS